jgi:hypothetical protein
LSLHMNGEEHGSRRATPSTSMRPLHTHTDAAAAGGAAPSSSPRRDRLEGPACESPWQSARC